MQKADPKFITNRFYRFSLGVALGLLVGGATLLSFLHDLSPTTGLPTGGFPDIILSFMTYGGFALIAFGYLYKRDTKKPFISDFALGCGIGLIVIYFINAGIGNTAAIPLSD